MDDTPNTPEPVLDDAVLLELANELHRLATGLRRDLQRNAVLPGLSDLTAMRPLQAMLTEALSARVGRPAQAPQERSDTVEGSAEFPGYL